MVEKEEVKRSLDSHVVGYSSIVLIFGVLIVITLQFL